MRFSFSFAHGEAAEISVEVSRHAECLLRGDAIQRA